MRNRSNSGIRLDYFQRLVNRCILKNQNPATGLIVSRSDEGQQHAWVRDNVYSIMAVWGLSLAYRKTADLDEDRAKAYELEKAVVMLMRGLLRSMMMQSDKLERFKSTQSPGDALHAKYCPVSGKPVVTDSGWGHLQIDATSLYILTLAQMTASGLKIIYTLDEVAFVQNLVFYIETAYRTPDYGIWERGDKTNHGLPELNSSSIGMAKAALEAINELDLFASRGGPASVIHVLPDETQQCQAILMSMLPRESSSKEIDASLLTIIGFPAFAVDDPEVAKETRRNIKQKLNGSYGCCRFLRDGYRSPAEDVERLYYMPGELAKFENLESQWPIFFVFYILDGLFRNNQDQVEEYKKRLDSVMVKSEDGIPMMPELYKVPQVESIIAEEKRKPNSQKREAQGQIPHMWGQSLYILSRLMCENFVSPGELDPLNRRQVQEEKPDVVVQVVILAEDESIAKILSDHGIKVQTLSETTPIEVLPARVLSQIFSRLGKSRRLGLTGRSSGEIGLLATSKLYMLESKIFAFIPQFMDLQRFYIVLDTNFLVDFLRTEVAFLKSSWKGLGRPTIAFLVTGGLLDNSRNLPNALITTIKKLQSGYISGTRVHMGRLSDFLTTSCITQLDFLKDQDDPDQSELNVMDFIHNLISPISHRPRLLSQSRRARRASRGAIGQAVSGIVRRSRSIQIDADQIPELVAQLSNYRSRTASVSHGSSSAASAGSDSSMPGSPLPQIDDEPPAFSHLKFAMTPQFHSSTETLLATLAEGDVNYDELVDNLKESESLNEQADIIHFLYKHKGPEWETNIDSRHKCTVKDLLVELYEKAGFWKQWWLVRHTAGLLKKRVEDLAIAATDLVVRQKQLSVGMPPDGEHIITCPLPPEELANIIFEACGEDCSTASLTQELLIYLAMFVRTEPKLFNEMLRLRVGLIIQVMASEMARTLKCSGEEASDHLMNLSPFEMKTLLHHILSGKEFNISSKAVDLGSRDRRLSIVAIHSKHEMKDFARFSKKEKVVSQKDLDLTSTIEMDQDDSEGDDRQGQWLRRRRLDGALNRVPVGFYPRIWRVLRRCPGLIIDGTTLHSGLTNEMTEGEFKFALEVEIALNQLPEPEYRQLTVEAMMILATMVENDNCKIRIDHCIPVQEIVKEANRIFIEDLKMPEDMVIKSMGARNICLQMYDSAPSGRHGTMTYMCRALARLLQLPVTNGELECVVS
ncbi:putative phosphorylase b kinase regulatory subunit alpha isoform X2 [Babylonia areolata]|uniref:putative phosphorylase b kinase regulatory subunit alpha isoform X2 n=1 Tax=Babylonia areolata TaxID=304850 RepID=UPI003FD001B2